MQEVVGFTRKQREWILERDGHRCQFRWFNGIKWVQCKETEGLEVHHIIPRGWAIYHMPHNFHLNGAMNGISLCGHTHHCGLEGVHPDTAKARKAYYEGNHNAFKEMMEERARMNQAGQPYWVTKWDWMLSRLARKNSLKFMRAHPYPENGNRGNTGRIQPSV